MLVYVLQVGLHHFRAMVRVVDFYTVEGNFGAYFVEQGDVIEGKSTLPAAGVGDEADGATTVRGIDGPGHICHNRMETCFTNHTRDGRPVGCMLLLAEQAA